MGTVLEPLTPNWVLPKDLQQWTSAKKDWLAGNLRKDSGAAIGKEEYTTDDKKYFPQPGDAPETVAQKARLREAEEQAMYMSAGRAREYIIMPNQGEQKTAPQQQSNHQRFGF